MAVAYISQVFSSLLLLCIFLSKIINFIFLLFYKASLNITLNLCEVSSRYKDCCYYYYYHQYFLHFLEFTRKRDTFTAKLIKNFVN